MALVILTGGARSGKSGAAARLATARSTEVVVAVAGIADGDVEMATRIERHRAERPAEWRTLEVAGIAPGEWLPTVPSDAVLILDCLGTLVTDLLWGAGTEPSDADGEKTVTALVDALIARVGDTIIVTNEVGSGVVPVSAAGRLFRDVLGRANARLVASADAAYLVVCGRCIDISASPADPAWPTDR